MHFYTWLVKSLREENHKENYNNKIGIRLKNLYIIPYSVITNCYHL